MRQVAKEPLIRPERFSGVEADEAARVDGALATALAKIDRNLADFGMAFPAPASKNNCYPLGDNTEWMPAFWTGMLWLAYELTGDLKYRSRAEAHGESFAARLRDRIQVDNHDLGFLYTLSCVAQFKLTGAAAAKATALGAAEQLLTRYCDRAGIIQAWGDRNDPAQQGRMIIDCLMNLPLLYWAERSTGEKRFSDAAYRHARQSAHYLVRDDASTYHTFYMDVETGRPLCGQTHQGYRDDSCWARGQAWGIYGFALSYAYTGDPVFLEISQCLANYFLNRLPDDLVCYWDLFFTSGSQERDSSAAAIAVCGLLELTKHFAPGDPETVRYRNAGRAILRSLIQNYAVPSAAASNGLLYHAVYNKNKGNGVDECCLWGDYFYLEALARLKTDWQGFW